MAKFTRASVADTIDRDINEVFDYVSDLRTMDNWVVGVSNARLTSGDEGGVGSVYEFDMEHNGETVPMKLAITTFEPPERIGMKSIEGPFPYEGEMTFSRDPSGGTRVVNMIDAGADGRFTRAMFTIFKPVLRWLMRRRLRSELDNLKSILEPDEPSGGGTSSTDSGKQAEAEVSNFQTK